MLWERELFPHLFYTLAPLRPVLPYPVRHWPSGVPSRRGVLFSPLPLRAEFSLVPRFARFLTLACSHLLQLRASLFFFVGFHIRSGTWAPLLVLWNPALPPFACRKSLEDFLLLHVRNDEDAPFPFKLLSCLLVSSGPVVFPLREHLDFFDDFAMTSHWLPLTCSTIKKLLNVPSGQPSCRKPITCGFRRQQCTFLVPYLHLLTLSKFRSAFPSTTFFFPLV